MATPIAELTTLLTSLFSAGELRRFLTFTFGRDVTNSLPSSTSLADLAVETVLVLQARGLLDAPFWDALRTERPRRTTEIDAVQQAWASTASQDGAPPTRTDASTSAVLHMLFLTADIRDRTLADREARTIRQLVRGARNRDRLRVSLETDISVIDVPRLMRADPPPGIVHFSGHSDDGHLIMRTPGGDIRPVEPAAIDALLKGRSLRMVVLNGSRTQTLADLLGSHIDYVVGCGTSVSIEAAAAFSPSFYEALCDGETVGRSFQDAVAVVSATHGIDAEAYTLGGTGDPEVGLISS